jgi:hypothetical protein
MSQSTVKRTSIHPGALEKEPHEARRVGNHHADFGEAEILELDHEEPEIDSDRRYSQQEIEKIIGRAAQAQAERDGSVQAVDGVQRDTALATAVELADTLNLDRSLVQQAFEEFEAEEISNRKWIARMDAQIHPRAIGKRLARELSARGREAGFPTIWGTVNESTYVIDQSKHQETAVLHDLLRRSLISTNSLNRSGTLPAYRVLVRRKKRIKTWLFGFIPWSKEVFEKLATLKIVQLEGKVMLTAMIHHEKMLSILGPTAEQLESDLGGHLALGDIQYDFDASKL